MGKTKLRLAKLGEEQRATVESARVQGAQTLRKGLSLLDAVAEAGEPLRFKDLLDLAGLPNSTLHRLLQSLIDYRLIRYEESDQTYRLGARAFEMAHKVWNEFDIVKGAAPELERLRELSRETARLGVLENGLVLVLDQRETVHPVRLGNGIGTRVSPYSSALGKALLAYVDPDELEATLRTVKLEALTPRTITDRAVLQRELALSKARGYAISIEEQHHGVNAVAAAILDHQGHPLGAVSVTGPAFRLNEQQLHVLGRDLIKSARRISGNIGEIAMSIQSDPKPRIEPSEAVQCIANTGPLLGEGPVWLADQQKLLWVDILGPAVHITTPATRETERFETDEVIGVIVPRSRGGYIAATPTGLYDFDPFGGRKTLLLNPETDRPGNRFNDGKCDARGRFWVGSFAMDASPGAGALYCLETDGTVRRVASGFHVSNGLGWSPDSKTLYFTDSGRRVIYAYDFDLESGRIDNRREFVSISDGEARPDGLAVDVEGYVWSAHWDGWRVVRYDPLGRIDRTIELPIPRPTSCAFGGPDLKSLYVTSARVRLSALQLAEAPLSGGVFEIAAGVAGLPVAAYGG